MSVTILNSEIHSGEFNFSGFYNLQKREEPHRCHSDTRLVPLGSVEAHKPEVIDGAENGSGSWYTDTVCTIDNDNNLVYIDMKGKDVKFIFSSKSKENKEKIIEEFKSDYNDIRGLRVEVVVTPAFKEHGEF